ncbi:pentatricopeptide repeat-containing protein At3g53170 [Selaginella moellendorffii]|nr:pentatricopeptide repeat-containing protein At3g53170 [Selaginella moellendorffii]|eukprot:XP_002990065.2 pentatricopeptide repeat-containing protein At3g53170 [Selaginella moellendorffii]
MCVQCGSSSSSDSSGGSSRSVRPSRLQWRETRQDKRSAREAMTVANRVMASEEASLRKSMARKASKLLPSSLLDILSDRIQRGQWEAALKVFELLRSQQWYQPYAGTYIRLLEMLGKCKRPDEAASLFQTMLADGCGPSREAFTALMSAYTRSNLMSTAMEVLQAMNATPHCSPDVFTYSLLIKSCCDCGQLSRASDLLADMTARGIQPNRVTYNIILDAYAKSGSLDKLHDLALQMLQSPSPSCRPDHWSRNAIVKGFGNRGDIRRMEEWFQRLTTPSDGPDSLTLHSLMAAYAKAEMFDKMHAVVRYIHRYHYQVDAVTYNILINAYGRAGRKTQMLKTFTSMKCGGVRPDSVTYCTLINFYGKFGMQRKLPRLLEQMSMHKVQPDTALYNSVLDAYRRASDISSIDRYFAAMQEQGCKPDHLTYNILIQAYRSQGLTDKADVMAVEQEKLKQRDSINRLFVSSLEPPKTRSRLDANELSSSSPAICFNADREGTQVIRTHKRP